jgi:hypothetical protein
MTSEARIAFEHRDRVASNEACHSTAIEHSGRASFTFVGIELREGATS